MIKRKTPERTKIAQPVDARQGAGLQGAKVFAAMLQSLTLHQKILWDPAPAEYDVLPDPGGVMIEVEPGPMPFAANGGYSPRSHAGASGSPPSNHQTQSINAKSEQPECRYIFRVDSVGWVREANVPEQSTASRWKQPDANAPVFFEIVAVEGFQMLVRGDAESQVPFDPEMPTWYFIVPPVGVSTETGALDLGLCAYPSRYLAFHYYYMFPMVGVHLTAEQAEEIGIDSGEGVYGAQPGPNKAGQYQAWHRNYNPTTGRWTTPDPATQPWTNLAGR
jgi:hypothetical protein